MKLRSEIHLSIQPNVHLIKRMNQECEMGDAFTSIYDGAVCPQVGTCFCLHT